MRRGKWHLRNDQWRFGVALCVEVGARDVVHVVVHADQTGEDCPACEVELGGTWIRCIALDLADGGNLAVVEDEIGALDRGRARTIDDADVFEDDPLGCRDFDVARDGGGGWRWRRRWWRRLLRAQHECERSAEQDGDRGVTDSHDSKPRSRRVRR
jgi:hypothetical protein